MEFRKSFSEIADKYSEERTINRIAEALSEDFKITSRDNLERLARLAYILFSLGDVESSQILSRMVGRTQFEGNYDYWTWISVLIVLDSRINREKGIVEFADHSIKRIFEALDYGNELQQKINKRNFERKLRGELLDKGKINDAVKRNDESNEFDLSLTELMKLVEISELGGSSEFPVSEANIRIQRFRERLNELILKNGLEKVIV